MNKSILIWKILRRYFTKSKRHFAMVSIAIRMQIFLFSKFILSVFAFRIGKIRFSKLNRFGICIFILYLNIEFVENLNILISDGCILNWRKIVSGNRFVSALMWSIYRFRFCGNTTTNISNTVYSTDDNSNNDKWHQNAESIIFITTNLFYKIIKSFSQMVVLRNEGKNRVGFFFFFDYLRNLLLFLATD